MPRKRSIIAGMTDYTGVGLDDIASHLRDWQKMTRETIDALRCLRADVEKQPEIFESPNAALDYVNYFCDLFARYASDFDRLLMELPRGVRESHIELISQLYRSSQHEEDACVQFKHDFIEHPLPNEQTRPVLDEIYAESRSMLTDYHDLSNLLPRLRTFVTSSSSSPNDIVQLKPTFWGVGIDLKEFWRRARNWWHRNRTT